VQDHGIPAPLAGLCCQQRTPALSLKELQCWLSSRCVSWPFWSMVSWNFVCHLCSWHRLVTAHCATNHDAFGSAIAAGKRLCTFCEGAGVLLAAMTGMPTVGALVMGHCCNCRWRSSCLVWLAAAVLCSENSCHIDVFAHLLKENS